MTYEQCIHSPWYRITPTVRYTPGVFDPPDAYRYQENWISVKSYMVHYVGMYTPGSIDGMFCDATIKLWE